MGVARNAFPRARAKGSVGIGRPDVWHVPNRRLLLDRRNEPQHAERVPYIISQGMPRAKLNDQAVTPEQMLENS